MMDRHFRRGTARRTIRIKPMWSFAGDAERSENERRRLQHEHDQKDREGFGGKIVVTRSARDGAEFISHVVYLPHELETIVNVYLELVQELKVALLQKWNRNRFHSSARETDNADMMMDHQRRDINAIRQRLVKIHEDHSNRLFQTESEAGGKTAGTMLLTTKDLHMYTWCLLLSYLAVLPLTTMLELVKTFLFYRTGNGRFLELLVRDLSSTDDQATIAQRQEQILQEDGSGLFILVDYLRDATTLNNLQQSFTNQDDGTVDDGEQRPAKRRRTNLGTPAFVSKQQSNLHGFASSLYPVPIPLSLMMLWVHLVDRELAFMSYESVVSFEALDKRLRELRSQNHSQFLFEKALRLYGFERLLLNPEHSPLSVKEAVATVLSHNETAFDALCTGSGLSSIVVYSRFVEIVFLNSALDGATDVAHELMRRKSGLYYVDKSENKSEQRSTKRSYDNGQSALIISESLAKDLLDPAYPLYVYLEVNLSQPGQLERCISMAKAVEESKKYTKKQCVNMHLRVFSSFMITNQLFDLDFTEMLRNPLYLFVKTASSSSVLLFCDFYWDLSQQISQKKHLLSDEECFFLTASCEEAICYFLRTTFRPDEAYKRYRDLTGKSEERYQHILKQLSATFTEPGPSVQRPASCPLIEHFDTKQGRLVVDYRPILRRAGCLMDEEEIPESAPAPSLPTQEFFSPAQHASPFASPLVQGKVQEAEDGKEESNTPTDEQNEINQELDAPEATREQHQDDVIDIDDEDYEDQDDREYQISGDGGGEDVESTDKQQYKDEEDDEQRDEEDQDMDNADNEDQHNQEIGEEEYNGTGLDYQNQGNPGEAPSCQERQEYEDDQGIDNGDKQEQYNQGADDVQYDEVCVDYENQSNPDEASAYEDPDQSFERQGDEDDHGGDGDNQENYNQDADEERYDETGDDYPNQEDPSEEPAFQDPDQSYEDQTEEEEEGQYADNAEEDQGKADGRSDSYEEEGDAYDDDPAENQSNQEEFASPLHGPDSFPVESTADDDDVEYERSSTAQEETETGDFEDEKAAVLQRDKTGEDDDGAELSDAGDGDMGETGNGGNDPAKTGDESDAEDVVEAEILDDDKRDSDDGIDGSHDAGDVRASASEGIDGSHDACDVRASASEAQGGGADQKDVLDSDQVAEPFRPQDVEDGEKSDKYMDVEDREQFGSIPPQDALHTEGGDYEQSVDALDDDQSTPPGGNKGSELEDTDVNSRISERPYACDVNEPLADQESVDQGYDATDEEPLDVTHKSVRDGPSYDSQEETASLAASQKAGSSQPVLESSQHSAPPSNVEEAVASSQGHSKTIVDVGYDAEESQGHSEDEDRLKEGQGVSGGASLEESVLSETQGITLPPADGYDAEESQGHTEEEDERVNEQKRAVETERSSVVEDQIGVHEKKDIALGDGYDATAEEESQGHTEEEEDRPSEGLLVDAPGTTLEVQHDSQEERVKGERHVEFALDPGYVPDDGQDHTEDEVPQNKVDGYQGGDSSIGQTEDEGGPTDIEDEESRRKAEPDLLTTIPRGQPSGALLDTQSISGMSAADELTTGKQDYCESSELDETNDKREVKTRLTSFQQAQQGKLQDYAAAAQLDYENSAMKQSPQKGTTRSEKDGESPIPPAFRSPKSDEKGKIAIDEPDNVCMDIDPPIESPIFAGESPQNNADDMALEEGSATERRNQDGSNNLEMDVAPRSPTLANDAPDEVECHIASQTHDDEMAIDVDSKDRVHCADEGESCAANTNEASGLGYDSFSQGSSKKALLSPRKEGVRDDSHNRTASLYNEVHTGDNKPEMVVKEDNDLQVQLHDEVAIEAGSVNPSNGAEEDMTVPKQEEVTSEILPDATDEAYGDKITPEFGNKDETVTNAALPNEKDEAKLLDAGQHSKVKVEPERACADLGVPHEEAAVSFKTKSESMVNSPPATEEGDPAEPPEEEHTASGSDPVAHVVVSVLRPIPEDDPISEFEKHSDNDEPIAPVRKESDGGRVTRRRTRSMDGASNDRPISPQVNKATGGELESPSVLEGKEFSTKRNEAKPCEAETGTSDGMKRNQEPASIVPGETPPAETRKVQSKNTDEGSLADGDLGVTNATGSPVDEESVAERAKRRRKRPDADEDSTITTKGSKRKAKNSTVGGEEMTAPSTSRKLTRRTAKSRDEADNESIGSGTVGSRTTRSTFDGNRELREEDNDLQVPQVVGQRKSRRIATKRPNDNDGESVASTNSRPHSRPARGTKVPRYGDDESQGGTVRKSTKNSSKVKSEGDEESVGSTSSGRRTLRSKRIIDGLQQAEEDESQAEPGSVATSSKRRTSVGGDDDDESRVSTSRTTRSTRSTRSTTKSTASGDQTKNPLAMISRKRQTRGLARKIGEGEEGEESSIASSTVKKPGRKNTRNRGEDDDESVESATSGSKTNRSLRSTERTSEQKKRATSSSKSTRSTRSAAQPTRKSTRSTARNK
ncbi:hypothetical protein ACA910_020144 [Epithemia clementina (nom. ined.)]